MENLKAGAAKVCINPPEHMLPAPNTAFHFEYYHVQDDIFVRTLALESGDRTALFVVIEVNDMGRTEEMKKAVSERCGLEKELIFFTVTHTHETPAIDYTHYKQLDEQKKSKTGDMYTGYEFSEPKKDGVVERVIAYGDFVIERVVECAQLAIGSMRDARLGCGEGKSFINVNRSCLFENGAYYDGVNFEGPSDKTLLVMKVTDLEGRLIAVLANYAVHGTLCFNQKGRNIDDIVISGDLPGMTSAYIEERFKDDGAVCLWTSGAAGDQVPFNNYLTARRNHNGTPGAPSAIGPAIWDICRSTAEIHAVDIIKVIKKTFTPWRELKFYGEERSVVTAAQKEVGFVRSLDDIVIEENGTVEIKIKLMTVGDMAFLGINGEISCPIGMRLRESSPYPYTFVIPHTAERVEYLPTKEEYNMRSTRFFSTIVKDGITEQLIKPEFSEMLENSLKCCG